ncbi:hypothetical protein [Vibrio crassostreae]|uniref:hypothetical protein n=1 Tax=Vibrio crassostreae TaxID=246167 RepID=UPI000F4A650A|nr:hypothetical protein [Vibrio crassostreae]ROO55806.1 hypothetical protein EDB56_102465 [Vibrio crassostreae]ROO63705.1 hypothetical protein EDB58_103247 [Vibrio crassostreae]ROO71481.1 hypothetical protein EDB57_2069 [Vibrio crassostreae]ROO73629.1 hypothetical protein EDB53_2347 [Vibrio crassostreae]ROR68134.1 hypothetical protein EDB59_1757 [Vibrio crassostreae]
MKASSRKPYIKYSAAILLALSCVSNTIQADELSLAWDWQLSAEANESRESPFTPLASDNRQSLNGLLDLEVGYNNWLGLFAVKANDILSNNPQGQEASFESEFIVRELFWQGGVELSNAAFGDHYLDVTLGKVRLDWGVGYGYRPLDIIKPYRQNPVGIVAEEGAGVAAASLFDMTGEWTLLYSDSSWASQGVNEFEKQNQQQGIGLRRYNLVGDHEYQWVAYYDDVRHGLLGASLVSVLNLAWELHGSVVYQRQSLGYSQPNSLLKPVYLEEQGEAYQALAGLTWANDTGHNVVLEYWFDSRAWSDSEWQNAIESAESLSVNPLTASLAGSYAQGYQHANLVQHNIMFHWSLDSTHGWLEGITPTFDVMLSPQDGGFIATQWLNYQAIDNGDSSLDLELAARFLGGKSDSAYANLPDSHMILLNIKGRF